MRREGGKGALANLQEGRLSHEMLAELQPLCMPVCVCACACVCAEQRMRVCDKEGAPSALSAVESFNESGAGSTKGCRTKGLQAENVQRRGTAQSHALLTLKHNTE